MGKKQNSCGILESIPAAFEHVPGRADCTGMSALCGATMAHLQGQSEAPYAHCKLQHCKFLDQSFVQ